VVGLASEGLPTTPEAFDDNLSGGRDAFALILASGSAYPLYLPMILVAQG